MGGNVTFKATDSSKVLPDMSAVLPSIYSPEDDGLTVCDAKLLCGCLQNSAILSDQDSYLILL